MFIIYHHQSVNFKIYIMVSYNPHYQYFLTVIFIPLVYFPDPCLGLLCAKTHAKNQKSVLGVTKGTVTSPR